MKIRELMTTEVSTVRPDVPLKEAARRMVEESVSGLPVVSDDGVVVGIITESDFVAAEADRRNSGRAGILRFLDRSHEVPSQERQVGDVMTKNVVTIGPDADHTEAARLMQKNKVKRLPVTEGDHLLGVISRADLMRAFTRSDDDILTEVNDHVISRVLWLDPAKVTVKSEEGNVSLSGRLETKSDAQLLVELVKRLDGVASVSDDLSWEVDNTRADMTGRPPGMSPRSNW